MHAATDRSRRPSLCKQLWKCWYDIKTLTLMLKSYRWDLSSPLSFTRLTKHRCTRFHHISCVYLYTDMVLIRETWVWIWHSVYKLQWFHLSSEHWEGKSTSFARQARASWGGAGGGVGGVSSAGGEAERPGSSSKARLLGADRPCAHHLVQEPTTWRPHGGGPRLENIVR